MVFWGPFRPQTLTDLLTINATDNKIRNKGIWAENTLHGKFLLIPGSIPCWLCLDRTLGKFTPIYGPHLMNGSHFHLKFMQKMRHTCVGIAKFGFREVIPLTRSVMSHHAATYASSYWHMASHLVFVFAFLGFKTIITNLDIILAKCIM